MVANMPPYALMVLVVIDATCSSGPAWAAVSSSVVGACLRGEHAALIAALLYNYVLVDLVCSEVSTEWSNIRTAHLSGCMPVDPHLFQLAPEPPRRRR